MMNKIIVLGAGMVGRAMAIDLSKDLEVYSADISEENLSKLSPHNIKIIKADFSIKEPIKELIEVKDLV